MKSLMVAVLAVSSIGCATLARFDPTGISQNAVANDEREKNEAAREKQAAIDKAARDEQNAKDKAASDERAAKDKALRAEQEAKAAKQQVLVLPDLAISVNVPGDVTGTKDDQVTAFGTPAVRLKGPASGVQLILTDGETDRYGIEERIRRQRAEYRWGMDVIRQDSRADGWEFEFSYPTYYTDGTRAGTEMGYFSRKVIGSKKVNCLISGVSETSLTKAIATCKTIALAR